MMRLANGTQIAKSKCLVCGSRGTTNACRRCNIYICCIECIKNGWIIGNTHRSVCTDLSLSIEAYTRAVRSMCNGIGGIGLVCTCAKYLVRHLSAFCIDPITFSSSVMRVQQHVVSQAAIAATISNASTGMELTRFAVDILFPVLHSIHPSDCQAITGFIQFNGSIVIGNATPSLQHILSINNMETIWAVDQNHYYKSWRS
jgi:hypothetical protein